MTPLALNAALIASLGAGIVDLALLDLAVVPALFRAQPELRGRDEVAARPADQERTPGPIKPATDVARPAAAAVGAMLAPREPAPAPALKLLVVLEFESSSHHLDSTARMRLRQQLPALRSTGRIVIVGHADERGPEAFNDQLSQERAEATLRQLVARAIPAERIELIARGERDPLASGNSRRVEIYCGGTP